MSKFIFFSDVRFRQDVVYQKLFLKQLIFQIDIQKIKGVKEGVFRCIILTCYVLDCSVGTWYETLHVIVQGSSVGDCSGKWDNVEVELQFRRLWTVWSDAQLWDCWYTPALPAVLPWSLCVPDCQPRAQVNTHSHTHTLTHTLCVAVFHSFTHQGTFFRRSMVCSSELMHIIKAVSVSPMLLVLIGWQGGHLDYKILL